MAASRNRHPADPAEGPAALVRACLSRLPADACLWVGLSGGRDSVVLLHLCRSLLPPGRLRAVHVHHGLSPHADAWAAFCRNLCAGWGIPLEVARVQVAPRGQGLEGAAREARYAAFAATGAEYLVLAHHARDQAETLLFNLCRGAGVAGAAAMPASRRLGAMQLLRPLLGASADSLAAYAASQELTWVEDESNQDTAYTRNFLRHQILPQLASRFPGIEAGLARAAGHFAEADALLEELAVLDSATVQARVEGLRALSPARRSNWLRHWLREAGWRAPETRALAEALRQMLVTPPDGQFEFLLSEGSLRLWRGGLYRVPAVPAPAASLVWQGEGVLDWGGGRLGLAPATGRGLARDRLAGLPLSLRPRSGGESIQPAGRPRRLLKKLLQEADLPPWERQALPLIYVGEELVACPGVAVAAGWACPPGGAGLELSWSGLGTVGGGPMPGGN